MHSWIIRLRYIGALLWVFGFIVLIPLVLIPSMPTLRPALSTMLPFLIPSLISLSLGLCINRRIPLESLTGQSAVVVVTFGWFIVSLFGSLPFVLGNHLSFLNALFESTSGFTTTGITVLTDLKNIPDTLILWRSLTQWIGGLGILTLFSVLVFNAEASHKLFGAESHKVISERPAPGMFNTLKILWTIYSLFTVVLTGVLSLEGLSWFDAINHSLTALSTGGFSPHNANIGYFQQAGFANYRIIEYTVIVGMMLGGTSFVVHYRFLRGEFRALWDSMEIKFFYRIILAATGLIMISQIQTSGLDNLVDAFRHSLFQVVAVLTTTGFGTRDIGGSFFPALAKQMFLILMVIGGMVGSTSGGLKVFRVGVLWKMVKGQIRKIVQLARAVNPLVVDGKILPSDEMKRISALFFAWLVFLVFGGMVTTLFSNLEPLAAFSGMFSALGNIGPSYISLEQWPNLHPIIRITYIIGMLAGRLEILPVLLLFSRRAWK